MYIISEHVKVMCITTNIYWPEAYGQLHGHLVDKFYCGHLVMTMFQVGIISIYHHLMFYVKVIKIWSGHVIYLKMTRSLFNAKKANA